MDWDGLGSELIGTGWVLSGLGQVGLGCRKLDRVRSGLIVFKEGRGWYFTL